MKTADISDLEVVQAVRDARDAGYVIVAGEVAATVDLSDLDPKRLMAERQP